MTKPPGRFKRIYLVNRDFQLRYARTAVIVGFCSTALTVFLILYPLFYLDIVRFPNFVPRLFLVAIAVASLLNFGVVALLGVMVTHRIAGPMFSLVRHMRMIQTGRWDAPMKVRATDDLKYLVRNFNELVDYLAAASRADLAKVELALAALDGPEEGRAAGREALLELKSTLDARIAKEEAP